MTNSQPRNDSITGTGRATAVFLLGVSIYIAMLILSVPAFFDWFQWLAGSKGWFIAALIIGSIYVLVAWYYFYENFLLPNTTEPEPIEKAKKKTAKQEQLISKTEEKLITQNIYIWMIQWFLPTVMIQIFIILGFWITIHTSPLKGCVYTHPYKYGLIYKQLETGGKTLEDLSGYISNSTLLRLEKKSEHAKEQSTIITKLMGKSVTATSIHERRIELLIYRIPFLIAFAFGFLGALIYTLRDVGERFYDQDLHPRTFVNYLIRFIFAPSLCIVIACYLANDWWVNGTPILFFLIGHFPKRAMQYVEKIATRSLGLKMERK